MKAEWQLRYGPGVGKVNDLVKSSAEMVPGDLRVLVSSSLLNNEYFIHHISRPLSLLLFASHPLQSNMRMLDLG